MADDLYSQLQKIVDGERVKIKAKSEKICKKHAQLCAKRIAEAAPKRTGKYAKSWKAKKIAGNEFYCEYEVYASGSQSNLTHLLENGHIAENGERVGARPHINKAADEEIEDFVEDITDEQN